MKKTYRRPHRVTRKQDRSPPDLAFGNGARRALAALKADGMNAPQQAFVLIYWAHAIARENGLDWSEMVALIDTTPLPQDLVPGRPELTWADVDRELRSGRVKGVPSGTTLASFIKRMQLKGELQGD